MSKTATRHHTSSVRQHRHPSASPRGAATGLKPERAATTTARTIQTLESHLRAAEGDLWIARCLALAEANPTLPACAARWLTPHAYDEPLRSVELFALPSRSQPGCTHLVRYHAQSATLRCLSLEEALETLADVAYGLPAGERVLDTGELVGCVAGAFGRPCRHAGSAWKWIAEHDRRLARTPAQRARDDYRAATDAATWDEVEAGAVGITILPTDS